MVPNSFRKATAFWLLLFLGFSLAVKLSLWVALSAGDPARFLEEDSLSYHNPAAALLHGGTFAVSPREATVPETLRTPGYPAFLALVYALAGERYAAATLVRPVAYYLVVPLAVGLVWLAGVRGVSVVRQRALLAALFLLPWVVGVGGWQLRNWRLTGSTEFCAIEGVELSWYRAAAVVAARDGISLPVARARLGLPADPWRWVSTHPGDQAAGRWKQKAVRLFLDHPLFTARVLMQGMIHTVVGAGDGVLLQLMGVPIDICHGPLGDLRRLAWGEYAHKWFRDAPGVFIAALLANLHLWLVYARVGLWCVWPGRLPASPRHVVEWLMAGLLVYFLIASGTPAASYRFRVPLMPPLCLLAALGWTRTWGTCCMARLP